mmetsp:Transcript_52927/g.134470  ORF Transcript_52927/g.134470 Transcript_52927/m.134470 type:complete len:190 (-) Transcript_52927:391-960(-)
MEEKEHTLVPAHSSEDGPQHVDGHRFCSDCWAEYLYHSKQQYFAQRATKKSMPLTCPLCRSAITVPDAWAAREELPSLWKGSEASSERLQTMQMSSIFSSTDSSMGSWAEVCSQGSARTSPTEAERCIRMQHFQDDDDSGDNDSTMEDDRPPVPGCRRAWTAALSCFRAALKTAGEGVERTQLSGYHDC